MILALPLSEAKPLHAVRLGQQEHYGLNSSVDPLPTHNSYTKQLLPSLQFDICFQQNDHAP